MSHLDDATCNRSAGIGHHNAQDLSRKLTRDHADSVLHQHTIGSIRFGGEASSVGPGYKTTEYKGDPMIFRTDGKRVEIGAAQRPQSEIDCEVTYLRSAAERLERLTGMAYERLASVATPPPAGVDSTIDSTPNSVLGSNLRDVRLRLHTSMSRLESLLDSIACY